MRGPRPGTRRFAQLSFLAGAAAGALAWALGGRHEAAFVVFVGVWYVLAYGVVRVREHPRHHRPWIVHVAAFPLAWVALVACGWLLTGHPVWSILFGAALAVAVQALVTQLVLRGSVVADQQHDLRRRLGLE